MQSREKVMAIFTPPTQNRHFAIDRLRFICAVMIVFLHVPYLGHDFLLPITRCAVPCFFMISGYLIYSANGIGRNRWRRIFVHIVKITLTANLLYAVFTVVYDLMHGDAWLMSFRQLLIMAFFNNSPGVLAGHLWYLNAYVYVLLIAAIADRYHRWNVLFVVSPALLLVCFALGTYSEVLLGHTFRNVLTRNFLFMGLPFFALGAFVKARQEQLRTVGRVAWAVLFVASGILAIAERLWLLHIGQTATSELYLGNVVQALSLLMFTLSFATARPNLTAYLGRYYSLDLYILHPIVFQLLLWSFGCAGLLPVFNACGAFFVLIVTLCLVHAELRVRQQRPLLAKMWLKRRDR